MERVRFEDINHLTGLYPQLRSLSGERQDGLLAVVRNTYDLDPTRRFSPEEVLTMLPGLKPPALAIERRGILVEESGGMVDPEEDTEFNTYPFADIRDVAGNWALREADFHKAYLIEACYRASQDAVMLALDSRLLKTRRHYILASCAAAAILKPPYFNIERLRPYQSEMELYRLGVSDCRLVDSINQRGNLARRLLVHLPLDLPALKEKWSACILPNSKEGGKLFIHPSAIQFGLRPVHHPLALAA